MITLLGENQITLLKGIDFTDPGATANDLQDGDLTASLVIDGNVDTSTPGRYTITYDVTDTEGNQADRKARTIIIVPADTTPPVIKLTGAETLSVLQNTTYTDQGATAEDDFDGDVTAAIETDNPVDTTAISSYTIVYNVSDSAGNEALEVTRTVDVIAADTTPPVLTLIGASAMNVLAGSTFTDPGASARDDLDGDLSADIIISGDLDTSQTGEYTLSYDVQDAAGNAAVSLTRTVTVITADATPPVISLTGDHTIYLDKYTVFEDPGCSAWDSVDGNLSGSVEITGSVNTSIVGSTTLSYNVTDAAGNPADTVIRTVIVELVDTTPPEFIYTGPTTLYAAQDADFTPPDLYARDDNPMIYIGDNITIQGSVDTAAPGTYTLACDVCDNAGNYAETLVLTIIVVAPGENQPPVADAGEDSTLGGGNAELSGEGSYDPDGDSLTYTWNLTDSPDGPETGISTSASADYNFTTAGTYTLSLTVSDGTEESTDTVVYTVINDAPEFDYWNYPLTFNMDKETSVGVGADAEDNNADSLSYAWEFLSRPDGSAAAFANPAQSDTTFDPDLTGVYTLKITVSDESLSASKSFSITVIDNTQGEFYVIFE